MDAKYRQEIEKRILTKFVEDVLRAGYSIVVHDGEECSRPIFSVGEAVRVAMATDDVKLYVFPVVNGAEAIGYCHFVYGNDGWDVISDHSVTSEFEPLVKGANDLSNDINRLEYRKLS